MWKTNLLVKLFQKYKTKVSIKSIKDDHLLIEKLLFEEIEVIFLEKQFSISNEKTSLSSYDNLPSL